jgi:hypothetical protein
MEDRMRLPLLILAVTITSLWARDAEFGVFAGGFIPADSYLRVTYTTSPVVGVDFLYHAESRTYEASISAVMLQDKSEIENFSGNMLPLRLGIRNYLGDVFIGGGGGLYLVTERFDDPHLGRMDETSTLTSAYLTLGTVFPLAGTDFEIAANYHLVDFLVDKSWIGLTGGVRL